MVEFGKRKDGRFYVKRPRFTERELQELVSAIRAKQKPNRYHIKIVEHYPTREQAEAGIKHGLEAGYWEDMIIVQLKPGQYTVFGFETQKALDEKSPGVEGLFT